MGGQSYGVYRDDHFQCSSGSMCCIYLYDVINMIWYSNARDYNKVKELMDRENFDKVKKFAISCLTPDDWLKVIQKIFDNGFVGGWNAHIDAIEDIMSHAHNVRTIKKIALTI